MFKSILGYCGDRQLPYPDQLAHELLTMCLHDSRLRDELFCQLIKQLSGNPSKDSVKKGWHLLTLCLSVFPPSPELENYVEIFLRANAQDVALAKLRRIAYEGQRPAAPTVEQIQDTIVSMKAGRRFSIWGRDREGEKMGLVSATSEQGAEALNVQLGFRRDNVAPVLDIAASAVRRPTQAQINNHRRGVLFTRGLDKAPPRSSLRSSAILDAAAVAAALDCGVVAQTQPAIANSDFTHEEALAVQDSLAVILYDYEPAGDSNLELLSVRAGQMVIVLQQDDPDWWLVALAENSSVDGWVPATYLQKL